MLDASSRPLESYREFVDHTKTKGVLAARLRSSYDDLYKSNKTAHEKTSDELKGWFKTKTGKGDSVALKMATSFKTLSGYADFSAAPPIKKTHPEAESKTKLPPVHEPPPAIPAKPFTGNQLGLVYRLEIHLPDTQNVETYRAIFKALREELA